MTYEEILEQGRSLQQQFVAEAAALDDHDRTQTIAEWAGGKLDDYLAANGRGPNAEPEPDAEPGATPELAEEVGRDDAGGTSGEPGLDAEAEDERV